MTSDESQLVDLDSGIVLLSSLILYMSTTLVPFLSDTLDGDPSDREGRQRGGATNGAR